LAGENRTVTLVRQMLEPLLATAGYELVDVEYQKEGRDWILRLYIDQETGIGLDDCQKVSHLVSELMDRDDPIPGAYLLEVSSPGLERPLKKMTDYQRFAGQKAEIRLFQPLDGSRRYTGKLLGVADGQVVLETGTGTKRFQPEQIAKAHLVYEF